MPGGIGSQNAITRYASTDTNTVELGSPNARKAAIMPASTDPTPPGKNGSRFAVMPTKKPCTSTAFGTSSPKAWKQAHRTAMLAAQNPAAPAIAGRPLLG